MKRINNTILLRMIDECTISPVAADKLEKSRKNEKIKGTSLKIISHIAVCATS